MQRHLLVVVLKQNNHNPTKKITHNPFPTVIKTFTNCIKIHFSLSCIGKIKVQRDLLLKGCVLSIIQPLISPSDDQVKNTAPSVGSNHKTKSHVTLSCFLSNLYEWIVSKYTCFDEISHWLTLLITLPHENSFF